MKKIAHRLCVALLVTSFGFANQPSFPVMAKVMAQQPAPDVPLPPAPTYEGDLTRPQDGPGHRLQRPPSTTAALPAPAAPSATTAAGDTKITLTPPKVKLRVEDGFDLDQYLYLSDSPINFNLDLQGFKPDPVKPTLVTLRVFDVDQQGAPPTCSAEVDQVYVNGVYLGNLTGANSQWSIVSFSIPAGTLNSGVNKFEVRIDTLATDCWAVEVDFAEIEMPFNLAQTEASATDDVTLRRGKTDDIITDPIWKTSFDAAGNLTTPNPNDPIADAINGTTWIFFSSNEFTYKYKIGTWPTGSQPTFQPRVEYEWEIAGTSVKSPSAQELTGWENNFKVKMPSKIGKYQLKVTLKIYRDKELLRTENRTHTLYALLNDPVSPASNPKTAWLDIATDWANGKDKAEDAMDVLNTREYANPFGWGYGYPKESDPIQLLENGAGKNGDCYVFRDVLQLLGASLGIATSRVEYRPPNGFLTSLRPALDGNASANSRDKTTLTRDRWLFGNHQVISLGSQLYDPTFGLKSTNKESNVFCKINGLSPGGFLNCQTLAAPPARALVEYKGIFVNGWEISEYETFVTAATAATRGQTLPFAPAFEAAPTVLRAAQSADSGVDLDNNALFDFLKVEMQITVAQAGTYGVNASLQGAGGVLLGFGGVTTDTKLNTPLTSLNLGAGTQTITVYFLGNALRNSAINGPYTVTISLNNATAAPIGPLAHSTQPYSYLEFQGLLAEVQSVNDQAVSTDGIPGYDELRTALVLNVLGTSQFTIQAQLFAGSTFLGNVTRQVNLLPGFQTLVLGFSGVPIGVSGQNGPYTVHLSISDANYTEDRTHATQAYLAQDFQVPAAVLSPSFTDIGLDTNGNGKFDTLNISGTAAALITGTYTLQGILQDALGNFISTAQSTYGLDNTPKPIALQFDGRTLNRSGLNGPYRTLLTLVNAAGNAVSGRAYTTTAYSASDFEPPIARFTGVFSDTGVDTNANTRYDTLRVSAGVAVSETGIYTVEGSLHDAAGNFIGSASTALLLSSGVQTVSLNFSGQTIWVHGANGPYHLTGLSLRHATSGTVDSLISPYITSAYARNAFEPFGLSFNGNFTDRGEDTNSDGLYNWLVIERPISITQPGSYNLNARLVDVNGAEIVWTSASTSFSTGAQTLTLRFDGRQIYGNGVDGPYYVRDFSIYSGNGLVSIGLPEAHTTNDYASEAFEPSGIVSGIVRVGANPLPNATLFIAGTDTSLSDANGAYRLAVPLTGTYRIEISANPGLAPWQISVNALPVTPGLSALVPVTVGVVTQVDFTSTTTNTAPTVSAGPNASGSEGSAISLSGSASDVDTSDTLTLTWTYAPQPGTNPAASCSFASDNAPVSSITCTNNGIYIATLAATDGLNPIIRASARMTVTNALPVITPIAPATRTISVGDEVTLGPLAFGDLGTIDTHVAVWNWGDGVTTSVTAAGNSVGSANHIYNAPGIYTASLTVTDSDAGASQVIAQIAVRSIPNAYAGRRITGFEGAVIALGSSTSAAQAALDPQIMWSWGYTRVSGAATASCVLTNPTGPVTALVCNDNGTFAVTVRLTDTTGNTPPLSDSTVVTVLNTSPVVSAPVPLTTTVYVGTPVQFGNVRFADPGTNDTHTAEWRWGDTATSPGTLGAGQVTATQHTYTTPGTYAVQVVVTDDDGHLGIGEGQILVQAKSRYFTYLPRVTKN